MAGEDAQLKETSIWKTTYKPLVDAAIKAALEEAEKKWLVRLQERDRKIEELKRRLDESSDCASSATWSRVVSNGATTSVTEYTNQQVQLISASAAEQLDRELRASNIIIIGLPASTASKPEDRVEHDKTEVSKLLNLLKTRANVKNVRRFAGPTREYTGPVQVVLGSQMERNQVLKMAKILKNNSNYSSCFIRPDETTVQRREAKRLREEVKTLNARLPTNSPFRYGIRDYGIVKRQVTRQQSD